MINPADAVKKAALLKVFALLFGLFLGLCILKFGNPVILDHKIQTPHTASDFWNDAWPTHWTPYCLVPLLLMGGGLVLRQKAVRLPWFLWVLPLAWFAWQLFAATTSVDAALTGATLWQYLGCLGGYFAGVLLFRPKDVLNWLMIGIFIASIYCLVRAVEQRAYEFPLNYQVLAEGEQTGWTNLPPETVAGMKQENVIIQTNGIDVANPVILTKFAKGRVCGTLVYPNALAGLILLLFPAGLALALLHSRRLRPAIRFPALCVVFILPLVAFFWTGSKLGWLLAIILVGIYLLHLPWSKQLKIVTVGLVLMLGLGIFAVRFHGYFAKGATSVGARFDYWSAAIKTTAANPLRGSGPGTFQIPYKDLKSPESEMARLAHNDYLEQFCDSGIPGGLFYCAWVLSALTWVGKRIWNSKDSVLFAIFLGLLGWFLQGLGEFSLFIPATAWIAFTLLGVLIGQIRFESTEKRP